MLDGIFDNGPLSRWQKTLIKWLIFWALCKRFIDRPGRAAWRELVRFFMWGVWPYFWRGSICLSFTLLAGATLLRVAIAR